MNLSYPVWIIFCFIALGVCGGPDKFLTSRNLAPGTIDKRSWDADINGVFSAADDGILSRRKRSLPNSEDSKTALDCHNYYRAVVGDEGEEPIPSNMKYMSWDPTLSLTSLIYAKKCVFVHSTAEERSTKDFPEWNGENLWAGSGKFAGDRFNPEVGIRSWYMEYLDYDFHDKYCVPGRQCGHYTQVVWANTYKVGCAWVNCSTFDTTEGEIWTDAAYMVCHYAPGGNKKTEFLYKVGERCDDCDDDDTCPDGRLCHNPERDRVLPGPSDAGHIVGMMFCTIALLGLVAALGFYLYTHRKDYIQIGKSLMKKTKIGHSGDTPVPIGNRAIHRNGRLPR